MCSSDLVVLSGEGADELFGGYTIYKEPLSLAPFEKIPSPINKVLAKLGDALPEGVRGKSLLQRGTMSMEERYYGNARSFNYEQLERVLREVRPEWDHREVTAPIYAKSKDMDPVARMQHLDLFTWLRGDILVKADKITMANSLELRVPFLDREMLELALSIPRRYRCDEEHTKIALRGAALRQLPESVAKRRKLGFPVPLNDWLRQDKYYAMVREKFEGPVARQFFNVPAICRLLEDHKAGRAKNMTKIWSIYSFILWYELYFVNAAPPAGVYDRAG